MKKAKIEKTLCILPILCLILCNCGSKKITQQELGNIVGEVYATGTGLPIPDVLVSCSGVVDTTDSSGAYSLLAIPIGMRSVIASKDGYELWKAFIEVRKGNNTLDIYMNSATPTAKGIVFYSQRTGSTQIFVMDADGSHQQQLTNLSMQWPAERGPLWSPDKEKIAFIAVQGQCDYSLILVNSDGTKLDTLVHDPLKAEILGGWAPDGSHIVYHAYSTIEMHSFPVFSIFIINSDGTNDMRLDEGIRPRFCGNAKVVYQLGASIYIINADGTGKKLLAEEYHIHGPFYCMPVGSPDGSKVAFSSMTTYVLYGYALGIMNADGSELRYLVIEERPGGTPMGVTEIEFSHDGQKILFLTNDEDNSEIFVINIDGSGLDSLTGGIAFADGGACWSPDGNWIAFTSNRKGNKDIYKVSVDGKILVQLTDDVADDFRPDW